MKNMLGKIVGAALLAAGIAAIWLWPRGGAEVVEETLVRPVRSMVVTDKVEIPELRFPGKVRANTSRDLVFEVAGRLTDFSLTKGQKVKKGDVLARLDSRDFESEVKKAEASKKRAALTLERTRNAAGKGGVSQEEVSKAEADANTAEALLAIARKALESCVLKAPYDGVVADTYPDSLDMVSVGQKILTLQNTDSVKIDVSVPETIVISKRIVSMLGQRRSFVAFDSLPGKEFSVKFEEFTAQADARTQTFTATFSMPEQSDYTVLPGMSVTLVVEGGKIESPAADVPLAVPSVAVGADEKGAHFVWRLEKSENDGEYIARKQVVEVGALVGTRFAVESGLRDGDRIAVAGVAMLSEGQRVTLWRE